MEVQIDTNPEGLDRVKAILDSLRITPSDLGGVVLRRLGVEHRKQERRIFATEGGEGGRGSWAPLHPDYAKFKREAVGPGKKILVWSGDLRERFVSAGRPEYHQSFTPQGDEGGVYHFGARSEIAAKHFEGAYVEILPQRARSKRTGKWISWPKTAIHVQLPVRDMVSKTAEQMADLRAVIARWWYEERRPQIIRALERARGPKS